LYRALHVAAPARERYGFRAGSFGMAGRVLNIDYDEAERISGAMNARRDLTNEPGQRVQPGMLAAAALLHELMHAVMTTYRMGDVVIAAVDEALGVPAADAVMSRFLKRFAPTATGPASPLDGSAAEPRPAAGPSWRVATGEEIVLHGLALLNRTMAPLYELFEPGELTSDAEFGRAREASFAALTRTAAPGDLSGATDDGDAAAPARAGHGYESLLDLLTAPQRLHPDSLFEQLRAALQLWGKALGERYSWLLERALRGLDLLREERPGSVHGSGPPPRPPHGYWARDAAGRADYSVDREWMPRVTMVAKNAFVWLEQLSSQHGRLITRLDQVPDTTLDDLVADGFNALWLVGVWQRSEASKTIKRLRGQPFAEASAYAIADYVVAAELGGEQALESLRARAWQRGMRLASDMVPNHTGLDSRWVVEHPERFLQLDEPPFAGYRFDGADVSSDDRVEVRIEDGYYDGSDAAVVYQVRDSASGRVRYLYHGNDGTLMPWNDTAQLDYLRADVRDAVVETILEVAGWFPIIRFDAAMTLVRRHIRRLWHPEPGEGGAIASRSRHAMAASAFEAAMPREFWREVVEAVAARAPDTLLLAEAFWLMESYFVRSLGMHRVYNSAFMHMLADEDNVGYRQLVAETLAFDPRILERFVNYLTNPDEESARERFGDRDKYFGAATVLATTPGLPMFGHGQVAGLREKYGMEFRAPRLREPTDYELVARHRREIAPLLRDREAFASSARFRLFSLSGEDGSERPDVIVYGFAASDRGASLVVFNNSPRHAAGVINHCEPFVDMATPQGSGATRTALLPALGLDGGEGATVVATMHPDGATVDWRVAELRTDGLALALGPYEYRVYRGLHLATPVTTVAVPVESEYAEPTAGGRRHSSSSLLAGRYGTGARRAAARRRRG